MVFPPHVSKLILMRCWLQTTLILALGSSLFAADEATADQGKDYDVFLARNPFSLRPPPPPPKPPEKLPEPEIPVNVKLTGISTLLNKKRVFLVNQPEGESPIYLKMIEGEVESGIEIVHIDPDAGAVKVKIDGVARTLTFEDDGFKATPARAQPRAPTRSGRPTPQRPTSTRRPIVSPSKGKIPAPPARTPPKFNFQRKPRTSPSAAPRTSSVQPNVNRQIPVPNQAQAAGNSISFNVNQTVKNIEPPRIPLETSPEEQVLKILATQERDGAGQLVTYELNGKTWTAFKATAPFPISAKDIGD
jgi:hypothetical protein